MSERVELEFVIPKCTEYSDKITVFLGKDPQDGKYKFLVVKSGEETYLIRCTKQEVFSHLNKLVNLGFVLYNFDINDALFKAD